MIARTIADLEACADVLDHHIMEAIAYRNLDRPTYLGSALWFFASSSIQAHARKHNSLITNALKQHWAVKCILTTA